MSTFLRLAFLLNAIALMAGSSSRKTGTGIASVQTLPIHLYDRAQAPARVVHLAVSEVGRLFWAARIQISWKFLSTESPEDQGTDMTSAGFQRPDTRPYLVVRLLRGAPPNIFPGALGYALPFARTGARVLIFYDRVETLAHSVNEATYTILGHALAHEIGHVLLGSSEHANAGLMQARWTPATWRLASAGLLVFRSDEAERMSAGLQKFQARRLLPVRQPTLAFSVRSPE
jgi:hypothetical protein